MKNCVKIGAVVALLIGVLAVAPETMAATIDQTLCVRAIEKRMSDGQSVTFWGFTPTPNGFCGMGLTGQVPGPAVEIGIGDTLNLTLGMMMAPTEPATSPYQGHTIHLHGADVPTSEDGVPEAGASTNGDTYTWAPTRDMAGSYMYHCHVHTVKHLEMGMYGALTVRPKNAAGTAFLNQLTADAVTAYDQIQTYLFSSVDPRYHTAEAAGDSSIFADYDPKYFLINGNEGLSTSAPALSLTAAPNQKIALRLIGLHSVHGTFSIKDGAGNAEPFTIYVQDGRQYATPEAVTSVDIAPGQRFDVIVTTPATTGTWYPQFEYQRLRDRGAIATVYGRMNF
jgi:FtsP/CotA-like multicopper oxidase with cupredoxin domain